MIALSLFYALSIAGGVHGQSGHDLNRRKKLSPLLLSYPPLPDSSRQRLYYITFAGRDAIDTLTSLYASPDFVIKKAFPEARTLAIQTTPLLVARLLQDPRVIFVESGSRIPRTESVIADFDNTVNTVNLAHAAYPDITGAGLGASVKEDLFDTTDIDLKGRISYTTISSNYLSAHASDMATLIAGGGNSLYAGQGAAWKARVGSSDFANLLPDGDAYRQYGISVQNHSYGVDIGNYYGSDAAAYDSSMIANPSLLHVFSSGNSGDSAAPDGYYKGLPGFANITGSFKMSKNSIAVGSLDDLGAVPAASSRGPAYDGRLKPELVAYGQNGSSEAAAITSGVALLVQDAYSQKHKDSMPDNALVKAILINSADDVGTPGIDFAAGYGRVDAYRSIQNMLASRFLNGALQPGQAKTFILQVPSDAIRLKLTLVWNDPPALPNATASLVNDLDLQLDNASTGEHWLPWVLNSSPVRDSLLHPPVRGRDSINVVEQITVDAPTAGAYTIRVSAAHILSPSQSFYIAYQWDTLNTFRWSCPARDDHFSGKNIDVFRWYDAHRGSRGSLSFSTDNGSTWQLIDPSVPLDSGFYRWKAPDTISTALARMTIGDSQYITDAFTISDPIPLQVGFDCSDSLLLYWNRSPGIDHYTLFSMGPQYLDSAGLSRSNFLVLPKRNTGYPYYAIAPVLPGGSRAVKSYTINATHLGVGCYFRNFLADLQPDNSVLLTSTLGTDFLAKTFYFQKQLSSGWTTLQTFPASTLSYQMTDGHAADGANVYRGMLELTNGSLIYSGPATAYHLNTTDFMVFPNPISPGGQLRVLARTSSRRTLLLSDPSGRIIFQQPLPGTVTFLSIPALPRGLYFLAIREGATTVFIKKMIIQ